MAENLPPKGRQTTRARVRRPTRREIAIIRKRRLIKFLILHKLSVIAGGKGTLRLAAGVLKELRGDRKPDPASLELAEESLAGLIAQIKQLKVNARRFQLSTRRAGEPELEFNVTHILEFVRQDYGLESAQRLLGTIKAEKRRFGLQMPKALESTESRPVEH